MGPLAVHGTIRIRCMNIGTSKWKEGRFEISEKDGKVSLLVVYNAGGIPKPFKLSQNIKAILCRANGNNCRLMVTLKDNSHLMIDKVSLSAGKAMEQYLQMVFNECASAAKLPVGSGSFGTILGSRSTQKEDNVQVPAVKNQTPTRRGNPESKVETPLRKPLGSTAKMSIKTSPGNATLGSKGTVPLSSSPPGVGLQEHSNNKALVDPSFKFLNSSREKQLILKKMEDNKVAGVFPLQSSSFYGSRSASKDYTFGNPNSDKSNCSSQSLSVKRSLGFTPQPSAVKKMRPNQDYTGWNKSRFSLSSQTQPLQGFSNLGNTCYMNAILQSLFSLQSFVNDLLKQRIPWRKIPINTLIRRFAFLLSKKDICSAEEKRELLKKVKGAISATAERFSGYMQNDAHEFLNQCLDQLKEDMEKLNKTWKMEPPSSENAIGNSSEDCSASRVYSCPVICNFEFEVQHSIRCKMCGEMVTKRERFNDLSIDLPRRRKLPTPRSIQDSLDLFFRTEDIEYSCEKCNGKSASVMHKFNRLPRILILHLKRYSFNVLLSQNNKVGQQVIIPRYLTLSSHCTDSTQSPLTLGWSASHVISQPLKASQMVNSCSLSTSTPTRKYSFKLTGTRHACQESDSEEEQSHHFSGNCQRLFDIPSREQQPPQDIERASRRSKTEIQKPSGNTEPAYDGMSEEELLATVLEMSKRETSLSMGHDEEYKPTSSPDTGFGEDEVQDIADHAESLEAEKPKSGSEQGPIVFCEISKDDEIVKDFDENKENKTPEGSQADVDWLQQFDRDREEQEIRQAMAQSIQDQEAQAQKEVDDLKRAKELSLQEFNSSLLDSEDSGNEDIFDMEYTDAETEDLRRNAKTGDLPHSYRLISIVSHIGSSSSSGHYISDVFDIKKLDWFTYDDLMVSRIQELEVQAQRDRTGYIFFYMHKEVFEELLDSEKNSEPLGVELGRPIRPPL
ncbi:ubiquitin carboxyl-terminal hydrolase 37 isoform X2 [Ambystoma mexicanum]|uniref:ubiquitin carboxyl-terminal hydrolase 37 isoform X2 n=1 Tax=Ambystoma mexicanum TaxID=8296 RepID=UPI0037E7CABA